MIFIQFSFFNVEIQYCFHHILLRQKFSFLLKVNSITDAIAELKEKKIRVLSEEPRIGAHGKLVVFLHPKDCNGVLVELEEA